MNQEKIGKFITKLRKDKNLTQQELANKLNVTDRAISNWENGRRMPDVSFFKPLCDVLNVTVNELLSGEKISNEKYIESSNDIIINTLKNNKKKNTKTKAIVGILSLVVITLLVTLFIGLKNKYQKLDMNLLYLGHLDPGFKLEKQFDFDNKSFYYYGVDNVQICDKSDNCVALLTALENKQITIDKIKEYYEEQSTIWNITKETFMDGGTTIYNDKGYTIMFCNTIDGNNDIYIGNEDMVEKLNGNYCGREEYRQKYFIRTYKIIEVSLNEKDPEFSYVIVENNKGNRGKVLLNNTNNLIVGNAYEFTFYAYEKFKDTIENIFNESTLMYTQLTDNSPLYQINEEIFFNEYLENNASLNDLEHVEMEIREGTLTNSSATIVITDFSGNKYIYGSSYRLDKYENNKWVTYDIICNNCAFNSMAYGPDKDHKLVFDINWEMMYGKLPKGTYRIIKDALLNNEKTLTDDDRLYISVEFDII